MDLMEIQGLLDKGRIDEAESFLDSFDGEKGLVFLLVKANIDFSKQFWGEAINGYNKVLEINPCNKEATSRLAIIDSILNFRNEGMFNV
jgi:hypothetical protein